MLSQRLGEALHEAANIIPGMIEDHEKLQAKINDYEIAFDQQSQLITHLHELVYATFGAMGIQIESKLTDVDTDAAKKMVEFYAKAIRASELTTIKNKLTGIAAICASPGVNLAMEAIDVRQKELKGSK
ncbi:hypothetical protein [Marisediminitalea sp.]|uniref:hypothetical protein n=1 Tax=Marisediminitalea sp. TaxID=2662268 RepID=UPI003512FD41